MLTDNRTARLFAIAMLNIAVAIALGAFGAHALKAVLSPYKLGVYEKACNYLVFQSLGVILLLLLNNTTKFRIHQNAPILLLTGTYLFSISVLLTAFSEQDGFSFLSKAGIVAPFGGLSMILAWLLAGVSMLKWRADK